MRHSKFLLYILLILISLPVFSQEKTEKSRGTWNGEFEAKIGNNFNLSPKGKKTSSLAETMAKIGYKTNKWNFSVSGDLPYRRLMTSVIGTDYKLGEKTSADSSIYETEKTQINAAMNAGWTPNADNSVNVYYSYNHNKNIHNYLTTSNTPVTEAEKDLSFSLELGDDYYDINKAGGSYLHHFAKEGRALSTSFDLDVSSNTYFSDWATGNAEFSKEEFESKERSRYRNTPSSLNNHGVLNARYTDPKFAKLKNLDLEFALKMDYNDLYDHKSASNYIDGQWKDSTSARENFRYRTYIINPGVTLRFHSRVTELSFTYDPEFFSYILDSDGKRGDRTKGSLAHNISFISSFKLGKEHTLNLSLKRRESRPSYLQLCWFPRGSSWYSDELYKGNPDLLNSVYTYTNLGYTFSHKRFTAKLGVDYNVDPRKIESTYYYDTYNDKEYRVNTWINGGRSAEFKINCEITWKSKNLMLNAGGTITFYRGYNTSGDLTKSSDYNLHFNGEYTYKTWKFDMNLGYQSQIIRSYASLTVIPACSFNVTKTFGEHFTAYLQCSQLLDKTVTRRTVSDDNTEERITYTVNNNRIFVLGVKYKF